MTPTNASPITITAVLSNPVQYTPGVQQVTIPYTITSPWEQPLAHVTTSQDVLSADLPDSSWGDEQVREVVRAELAAKYGAAGFAVEVLLVPEMAERQETAARAAAEAERAALAASAKALTEQMADPDQLHVTDDTADVDPSTL